MNINIIFLIGSNSKIKDKYITVIENIETNNDIIKTNK